MSVLKLARAYPGATFGLVSALVLTGGIFVNALVLQKQRHPAPLFAPRPQIAQTQAQPTLAPAAEAVPQPAPRPVNLSPGLSERPATVQRVATREAAETTARGDAIANLLRNGPAAQAGAESSAAVLGAQRALARLGFAVKPDGVMGGATRQAIERFERDHGLPARGDLTPKIMRMLAAQSGVAID
jgi:peptidoglycan hydrolase-like protein with peptidoglycan-binding domain